MYRCKSILYYGESCTSIFFQRDKIVLGLRFIVIDIDTGKELTLKNSDVECLIFENKLIGGFSDYESVFVAVYSEFAISCADLVSFVGIRTLSAIDKIVDGERSRGIIEDVLFDTEMLNQLMYSKSEFNLYLDKYRNARGNMNIFYVLQSTYPYSANIFDFMRDCPDCVLWLPEDRFALPRINSPDDVVFAVYKYNAKFLLNFV